MKRLVCFLLTVIMLVGMIPMTAIAEDGALSFTDVQEKHWFHDAVKYCVENPDKCKSIGDEAYKLIAERYSNDQVVNQLVTLYKEII